MLDERTGTVPDDRDGWQRETRELELGLARRKVELHEHLLAGDRIWHGVSVDQARDLLAGARTRLAELEAGDPQQAAGDRP